MKPVKPPERAARPIGHDYASEIAQRLGNQPNLFHSAPPAEGASAAFRIAGADEKRRPYEVAEGVAIIDIRGYLSMDPFWWDETGYGEIQGEVAMALEDAEVKGILLRIDSPGGETDGAFETAAFLAEARKKKPLWAVADVAAYSAAYLMASQAQRIYAAPISGGVGSIGVYMMHVDMSAGLKEAGIKVTFLKAGTGKTAGNPYEPLSEEAQKRFQANVDRLYGEFVGAVARGRKMDAAAVVKLGAWLYEGAPAAMEAGLADASGTAEDAWLALATKVQGKDNPLTPSASAEPPTAPPHGNPAPDSQKGHQMDEKNNPNPAADPANPSPPTQQAIAEAVTKAKADGYADAAEVAALCTIAKKPQRIADFLAKKTSAADVRAALQAEAVAEDAEEVDNKHEPKPSDTAGEGANASSPLGNLIVTAAKQYAGQPAQKGA